MSSVVVDASLILKWFVAESDSSQANRLWLSWLTQGSQPVAPSWVAAEVSNALLQAIARGQFTIDYASGLLRELPRFVRMNELALSHSLRALKLAHQTGLRATYDLHYLAMAEQLDCELWTADERFWRTVQAEHPRVRWLGNERVVAEPLFVSKRGRRSRVVRLSRRRRCIALVRSREQTGCSGAWLWSRP